MNSIKISLTLFVIFSNCLVSCCQVGLERYNKGVALMDEGNYQKAIEVFSSGIEQNDIARSANYFGRALANYEIGKIQEAKSDIEMSLTTESFNNESINSVIYWLKGMIANHEGDKGLEIKSYEKAIEYSPDNTKLKTTLGFAFVENGNIEKAIIILSEVIQKNNQDAYAFNNRALAFIKSNQLEKAKSDLDYSKKLDSDNPFLFKNYYLYYKQLGEEEKACQALQIALQKDMSDYGEENDSNELIKLQVENCKQ